MLSFRQTLNIVFVCFILPLGFEPFVQASSLKSFWKERSLKKNNFHSMSIEIFGKNIKVSGMSHPGLWGAESSRFLQEQGVTHLLSLESKFGRQLQPLLSGVTHKVVDVADMTAPSFEQLKDILLWVEESLAQNPEMHLGVHCWGGNGRTGTVLAFLKLVSNVKQSDDGGSEIVDGVFVRSSVKKAIQAVRSVNKNAIEVPSQVQALNAVDKNKSFYQGLGQQFTGSNVLTEEQRGVLIQASIASALRHSAVFVSRTSPLESSMLEIRFPVDFSNSLYKKSLKKSGKRASDYAVALVKAYLPPDVSLSVAENVSDHSLNKAVDFVLENYPNLPNVVQEGLSADPVAVEELKFLSSTQQKWKPFQKMKSFVPGFSK